MSQVGCGAQWLSGFFLGTRMLGGTAEAEEAANGGSEIGIGSRLGWVPKMTTALILFLQLSIFWGQ